MKRCYRGTNLQTLAAYPNAKSTISIGALLQQLQSMPLVSPNHHSRLSLHFAPSLFVTVDHLK